MHIRHQWSRWSEPVVTQDRFSSNLRLVQIKTCNKCGLQQQITVGSPSLDTTDNKDVVPPAPSPFVK